MNKNIKNLKLVADTKSCIESLTERDVPLSSISSRVITLLREKKLKPESSSTSNGQGRNVYVGHLYRTSPGTYH